MAIEMKWPECPKLLLGFEPGEPLEYNTVDASQYIMMKLT